MPAPQAASHKQFQLEKHEHEEMAKRTEQLKELLNKMGDVVLAKIGVEGGGKRLREVTISMPSGKLPLRIGFVLRSAERMADRVDRGCYMDPPGVCLPGPCPKEPDAGN